MSTYDKDKYNSAAQVAANRKYRAKKAKAGAARREMWLTDDEHRDLRIRLAQIRRKKQKQKEQK